MPYSNDEGPSPKGPCTQIVYTLASRRLRLGLPDLGGHPSIRPLFGVVGFRVQGLGVWGLGFGSRVSGFGFRVFGFRVLGFGFLGFGVFGVQGWDLSLGPKIFVEFLFGFSYFRGVVWRVLTLGHASSTQGFFGLGVGAQRVRF